MRCRVALVAAALSACTPEQLPSAVTIEPALVSAPIESSDPSRPFDAFPTLATAGADSCRIPAPIHLGANDGCKTLVGFGPREGIATWKRDANTLAIQPLGLDGVLSSSAGSMPMPEGIEPDYVFAVEHGFVILLRRWDWRNHDASWLALPFDDDGRAGPLVDIGLADMNVRVGQALDSRRIGLIVAAAAIAEHKPPGRWQTLTVTSSGQIVSTPIAVETDDLVTTTSDTWEPAELGGKRGWLVMRDGERRPEGVFEGVRMAVDGATLVRPSDGLVASVVNGAVPPPRSPGGTVFEASGRPVLVRTRDGEQVGERLYIEWHGTRVGVFAMNVESALVWTGTRFIYPFCDERGANLLPIDCNPQQAG